MTHPEGDRTTVGESVGASSASSTYVSKAFTNKKVSIVLTESNFLMWKQQVLLAVRSLRLEKLLTGVLKPPPATVTSADGVTADNEAHEVFVAQDSAIASWLLSTISSPISNLEKIATILNGLPMEYQPFVAVITASQDPFTLDAAIFVLIDAETQINSFNPLPDVSPSLHVAQVSASRESGSSQTRPYRSSGNGGRVTTRNKDAKSNESNTVNLCAVDVDSHSRKCCCNAANHSVTVPRVDKLWRNLPSAMNGRESVAPNATVDPLVNVGLPHQHASNHSDLGSLADSQPVGSSPESQRDQLQLSPTQLPPTVSLLE
ncbi:hypothetical protein GQ457_11G000210 [Hibiscus cannabinus]